MATLKHSYALNSAVKSQRRCKEAHPSENRKAFRLCIAPSDWDRLLDESKWPEVHHYLWLVSCWSG